MQASGRLGLGEALGVGWAMGAFGGIKTGVTVVLPANALKASDLEDLGTGCGLQVAAPQNYSRNEIVFLGPARPSGCLLPA